MCASSPFTRVPKTCVLYLTLVNKEISRKCIPTCELTGKNHKLNNKKKIKPNNRLFDIEYHKLSASNVDSFESKQRCSDVFFVALSTDLVCF